MWLVIIYFKEAIILAKKLQKRTISLKENKLSKNTGYPPIKSRWKTSKR